MGRRTKYTFLQRRHVDGQQAHEKMFKSLIIREVQIETTVTPHSSQNAIIKKPTNNKYWKECGDK